MTMNVTLPEFAGTETQEFKEEAVIHALTAAVKLLPRRCDDSNSYAMTLLIERVRSSLSDYMEIMGYNPREIIGHFEREGLN